MTQHGQPLELSPKDRRLLDALVECNFDPQALEALSPDEQRRVDSLVSLFELLEDYPVEDADESLVHATLARVDRYEEQRASRMAFGNAAEAEDLPRRQRVRMPDFISIAAVILIGASVVWPLSTQLHRRAIDTGCANNMRRMALAFDQYASDFDRAVPIAQAGVFSNWNTTRHNAVNLNPLLDGGYCDRGHLSCPGHKGHYGESYSYQWQMPGQRMIWGVDRVTLMLGDRNPLIDGARAGQWMPALTISLNHGGRGQNVLSTDGATIWFVQPLFGHNDNIWLPSGVAVLQGDIKPKDPADVFLAH
ncbi:MAG: hypothetical protein ACYS15_02855 [Planctomycetota bacterium]|jgi:hypothetical protein